MVDDDQPINLQQEFNIELEKLDRSDLSPKAKRALTLAKHGIVRTESTVKRQRRNRYSTDGSNQEQRRAS